MLNDYQKSNLNWLLRNIKEHLPGLVTGDWFDELLVATSGAETPANFTDEYFENVIVAHILDLTRAWLHVKR